MALFGNDRPVMPSFRTTPELDSSERGPYDDLNRIERNLERSGRQLDRDMREERNARGRADHDGDERREVRDRERNLDARNLDTRNQDAERNGTRTGDRAGDRHEVSVERPGVAAAKPAVAQSTGAARPHALIEGLFDKLPAPESEWPLQARQKWLQTAANIFDLMYTAKDGDAGEIGVAVERAGASR